MPHQAPVEDEDPIIASYPVYLTSPSLPSWHSPATTSSDTAQKLLLLQYPAHRPAEIPYNARNLQKPSSLRLKPSTGLLELDIPIDTKLNYNPEKGSRYATSLSQSRAIRDGATHGLSGGFNTGPASRIPREDEDIDMKTIPAHSPSLTNDASTLNVQTLGGKIVKPSTGDPIYLLGSFRNASLHLSHLDALIQLRPQLPHLDAVDELERNRNSALARSKSKEGAAAAPNGEMPTSAAPAGHPPRPESKAIDLKLKSSTSTHNNDLTTNTNAKLLRAIQQEPWQTYVWIDEDELESAQRADRALHLPANESEMSEIPKLESALSNAEWLDLMSAPRVEHGKKGLIGKVRGREREKARRKRNEMARREKAVADAATREEEGGGGQIGEESVDMEANETAPNDTAEEDEHDEHRAAGPSDEESSEDEHPQPQGEPEDNDVEMQDTSAIPQIDGSAAPDSDEEVVVLQRPEPRAPTAGGDGAGPAEVEEIEPPPARRRGRPRKFMPSSSSAVDPIVVDD